MERLNLKAVKDSSLPDAVGLCSTDGRFTALVNEGDRRLVRRGKYWGTFQRYAITSKNQCLVWPRQVAAIEVHAINDIPYRGYDQWYEFLDTGFGLRQGSNIYKDLSMVDRGTAVVYEDPQDADSVLRVWSDVTETTAEKLIIQGYDENGQWIRTLESGSWIDGVALAINTTPVESAEKITAITGIIKPATNGVVRLALRNTVSGLITTIGYYEHDERRPRYRKTFIDGLSTAADYNSDCVGKTLLTCMVKLDHIDVSADNDWLVIQNLDALRLACQAVQLETQNLWVEARRYWSSAFEELEHELEHYEGSGAARLMRVEGETWGNEMELVF